MGLHFFFTVSPSRGGGLRVSLWLSGLKIQHCRFYSYDDCCGMGSFPGLGTPHTAGATKEKKEVGSLYSTLGAEWAFIYI